MSDAGSEEEEDQGPSLGVSFSFCDFLEAFFSRDVYFAY
jgi:hypothetical protein